MGWLIAALGVVVIAVVVFLAPDLPRRVLGMPGTPVDRGSDIQVINPVSAAQTVADPTPARRQPTTASTLPVVTKASATTAPTQAETPVVSAPVVPADASDETKAAALISEARKAYKEFRWEVASTTASKVARLQVTAKTRQQAIDLVTGAAALSKMFSTLNDRDELSRNYDTHPSLVELTIKGDVSMAVPTVSNDQLVAAPSDPLAAIEKQKQTGKVTFFMKGRKDFVVTTLEADAIEAVKPANLTAIRAQVRAEFTDRLRRLSSSDDANQALAWYEAGRFALRNRIDDQVTDMMDRGLELDPDLVTTVREDRAHTYMAAMMVHLNNGNRVQAQTFLNTINKRFGDTAAAKQAQAYFDGDSAKVLALAKQAEEDRVRAEELKTAQIAARDQALGKATTVAAKVQPKEEEPVVTLTGDAAVADGLLSEGRALCAQAMEKNGADRNKLFDRAEVPLRKSRSMFAAVIKKTPTDQVSQLKMLEVNQLIYLIKKGKVFR